MAVCDIQHENGAGKLAADDVGGEKVQGRGQNQVTQKRIVKHPYHSNSPFRCYSSDAILHDDNKSFCQRQGGMEQPAIARSMLDLPQPEGPTMSKELPACRDMVRSRHRCRDWLGVKTLSALNVSPACLQWVRIICEDFGCLSFSAAENRRCCQCSCMYM